MGSKSKTKGARGERECAAELGELLGIAANRGRQYHGGPDSPDVVLHGCRLHVEAKRVEALALYQAVEQAAADAPADAVPVVWHRRNGKPSVVIVETSRLVALAREIMRVAARRLEAASAAVAAELEELETDRAAAHENP